MPTKDDQNYKATESVPHTDNPDNVELATYVLKAGGHCDNFGPDDGNGNPANVTGEQIKKETFYSNGIPTEVPVKHNGILRHFNTMNERNPAVFKSPQLDLHVKYPHKYQRVDGGVRTNEPALKPVGQKPRNDLLEGMTKNQLLALAEEQEVDLSGITEKRDMIKKLREVPGDAK